MRWLEAERKVDATMTKRGNYKAITVPFAATLRAETPGIAQWAHPLVWTESMLSTLLENKVKGGKWHTLYDKVMSERNLSVSAMKVVDKQGAAGVDKQTVQVFFERNKEEINRLQLELKDESYRPLPVRRGGLGNGNNWVGHCQLDEFSYIQVQNVLRRCKVKLKKSVFASTGVGA